MCKTDDKGGEDSMDKRIVVKGIILYHFRIDRKKYKNKRYKIHKSANVSSLRVSLMAILNKQKWIYVKRLQKLSEKQALMICNGTSEIQEVDYAMVCDEIAYKEAQIYVMSEIGKKGGTNNV